MPYELHFDDLGTSDDARVKAMNALNQQHCDMPVVCPARLIRHSTPIELWSGMVLRGTNEGPAREFDRRTRFQIVSGAQFKFVFPQTGQSYPSSGAPRDITLRSILFMGSGKGTHWFEKHDPREWSTENAKYTLWSSEIRDCGWKNFETVWWGWGDNVSFGMGASHIQNCYDTELFVGGSECAFFDDSQSVMDSPPELGWGTVERAHFRSLLSKSHIGNVMITARGKSYGLSVEGGHGLWVAAELDAQNADPMDGPCARISGGTGILLNGSYKGCMDQAASYPGKGFIDVTGGKEIVVDHAVFQRLGTSAPASTPIVSVSSAASGVKIGLNTYEGFSPVRVTGPATIVDPEVQAALQPQVHWRT